MASRCSPRCPPDGSPRICRVFPIAPRCPWRPRVPDRQASLRPASRPLTSSSKSLAAHRQLRWQPPPGRAVVLRLAMLNQLTKVGESVLVPGRLATSKGSWRQRKNNQRALAWRRVTGVPTPATFMGESRTRRRCPGWGHRLFRKKSAFPPASPHRWSRRRSSRRSPLWLCHIGPSGPQCDLNRRSHRSQKNPQKTRISPGSTCATQPASSASSTSKSTPSTSAAPGSIWWPSTWWFSI